MTSRSDVRALIKRAKKRGWVVEPVKGKGGHHRLRFPPTGDVVIIPATPSDHRGLKNAEALITRISGRLAAPKGNGLSKAEKNRRRQMERQRAIATRRRRAAIAEREQKRRDEETFEDEPPTTTRPVVDIGEEKRVVGE